MKSRVKPIIFTILLVALTGLAAYGSIYLSDQLSTANTVICSQKGVNHQVAIKNSVATPSNVTGKLCDTLAIKNEDDVTRFMAFGQHDNHQAYDGVSERTLGKDQSLTVTMDKTGEFLFHDHLHNEVQGIFTVR